MPALPSSRQRHSAFSLSVRVSVHPYVIKFVSTISCEPLVVISLTQYIWGQDELIEVKGQRHSETKYGKISTLRDLRNHLWEFNQIYNFDAVGDKDEPVTGQMVEGRHHGEISGVDTD